MEIITFTGKNEEEVIKKALEKLKTGGIIIYPTETTYGMGVDATNQKAVDKLFSYKEKREGKPLSIAVADREMATYYVDINEVAANIYRNFLPGPVTVVSEGKHILAKGVESLYGTLGVRIPDYPLILSLSKVFEKPITATSANASYQKRPYKISDILENISQRQKNLIDLIIDAGELAHNEPSTVIDTTLNTISVLRQGDIMMHEYEEKITHSAEETEKFGGELLSRYKEQIGHKPVVFALQGDMGAGKTHFTKGIGAFLQIIDTVDSPTYILENEYPFTWADTTRKLIHIDTWRMLAKEEFDALHIEKRVQENDIIVIEWAEKVYAQIKSFARKATIVWVKFKVQSETVRQITFSDTFIK